MSVPMQSMQCPTCVHKWTGPRCAAFPDLHEDASGNYVRGLDIREEIWTGDSDHRLPYEGDNGIRFEPLPEFADRWAEIPVGVGDTQTADPDYIGPLILCPDPHCDDGEVHLPALGIEVTCPVCHGEIRIGVDGSPEAMRWAVKRKREEDTSEERI